MLVIHMKSVIALLIGVVLATPAAAQIASKPVDNYAGELIMDKAGGLVAPWKLTKTCQVEGVDGPACRAVIINSRTREIAKLGEKWSGKFSPTGVGLEVRRLESTMDAAKRRASSP